MKTQMTLAALSLSIALAGCAAPTLVNPGPYAVGSTQVTVGRAWSDISVLMEGRPKGVRLLSIDGPLLNRLYVSDGLKAGDFMVRPQAKEKPTPVIRDQMSASERMEFVTDSVAALGYLRVERQRPRPASLAGKPAVRFDLTAQTPEGLEIAGTCQIAEIGGRTYVVLFLAPAEHYFGAALAEVESVMASATPTL
jgi:hypothetical protein